MADNMFGLEVPKRDYSDWKKAIQKHKGIQVDGDDTYDYEGFYNENPERAWEVLNENPDAHFTDKYKTASHPSFSNESKYSGRVHPKYNPRGIEGGTWEGDDKNGWTYRLSKSQFNNNWDYGRTQRYFREADPNVRFKQYDGSDILDEVVVKPRGQHPRRGGIIAK